MGLAAMLAVVGAGRPARAAIVIGPGLIVASVRDASNRPISGALVVADGPTERDATTSAAGVVSLSALPLGTYDVRVTRSGYTPYGTIVRVAGPRAPQTLAVQLATANFADVRDLAVASTGRALGAGADPFAAHAVLAAPGTALVATGEGSGTGIVVDGALPYESRIELDGIPIAGGSSAYAALRFRSALALDDVAVARGPAIDTTSVRDTIGGVVDYRTPSIADAPAGGLDFGYDSAFGSFQHARYSFAGANLGAFADLVTGGGENRSQTLKARYAISPDVALSFAAYGSQSSAAVGDTSITSSAPAFSADVRASLGRATLAARAFSSTATTVADATTTVEDARVRGLQLAYDAPAGENLFGIAFDRRSEATLLDSGENAVQTFETLTVHGDIALAAKSRLELADALSSGSNLAHRHDPRIALAIRASPTVTLRLAAGSAFATEPAQSYDTAALADATRAPETSFGYRIRADADAGSAHVWGSLFTVRRFDVPSGFGDVRTAGLEAGIERAPLPGRVGGTAYLDLERRAPGFAASVIGDPPSKAHVAVAYRAGTAGFEFGTTLLGPGNVFGARAVALGNAGLRFPLLSVLDARIGIENLFGARAASSTLAPLFAPHEFTLTIGRSPGS